MRFSTTKANGRDGCVILYADTATDGVFLAQLADAMKEAGYAVVPPKPNREEPYLKMWPKPTGEGD